MKHPPALANWLLTSFSSVDDALVGDIFQEWSTGRSTAWFWHQTLSAIACATVREMRRRPWRTCTALLLGWSVAAVVFLAGDTIADGLAGRIWGWNRQDAYATDYWAPFYAGAFVVSFGGFSVSAWLVARLHRRAPAMLLGYVAITFALLVLTGIALEVVVLKGKPFPMWHPLFYATFTTLPFFWHSGVVLVPFAMLLCGTTALRAEPHGLQPDSR
jgi:hypothetical protein